MKSKTESVVNTLSTVYLHIGNGGVTVSVLDTTDGIRLDLKANHFGNVVNSASIFITQEALGSLVTSLQNAHAAPKPLTATHKTYVHAAFPCADT